MRGETLVCAYAPVQRTPRSVRHALLWRAALLLFLAMGWHARADAQQAPPKPSPAIVTHADSVLEARTRHLAAQLRCPVCQGLSLQDSPSELSQQMRDVVKSQLAAGKSEDEVKAYFVARYGEWILMSPPAHGFNILVYLLPFVVLAGGVGLLVFVVKRWMRMAKAVEASGVTPTHLDT